jgi:hypothetical protein
MDASFRKGSCLINRARCARWPRLKLRCNSMTAGPSVARCCWTSSKREQNKFNVRYMLEEPCSTMTSKQRSGGACACCPAACVCRAPHPMLRFADAEQQMRLAAGPLGCGSSCGLRDRYPAAITITRPHACVIVIGLMRWPFSCNIAS